MKQTNLRRRGPAAARRIAGHAQEDHILDRYQRQQKLDDDTIRPQCSAVYHKGRWQWGARPQNSHEAPCPACRRIKDKFPAGVIELRGALEPQQKEEIVRLARHQEETEKSEHPLNALSTSRRMLTGSSSIRQTSTCRAGSAKPWNAPSMAASTKISMKVDTSYASIGRQEPSSARFARVKSLETVVPDAAALRSYGLRRLGRLECFRRQYAVPCVPPPIVQRPKNARRHPRRQCAA